MYIDIYTHTYISYMSIITSVGRTDGTWLPAPFRPALLAAFVYKLGPTEFTYPEPDGRPQTRQEDDDYVMHHNHSIS